VHININHDFAICTINNGYFPSTNIYCNADWDIVSVKSGCGCKIAGYHCYLSNLLTVFLFFPPLWLYRPIQALATSMKLSISLQLLDLGQSVGLLGQVISLSHDLYLYTNTEKHCLLILGDNYCSFCTYSVRSSFLPSSLGKLRDSIISSSGIQFIVFCSKLVI
jgi:hypothetical protein